ncbi:MAG: sigma-70 family RNA polymerase sigma factor, partial [Planctomycetia bacterium]|nr:sigma-70 family RNA polymerase sigma factor [Planctomycetia bacterium]
MAGSSMDRFVRYLRQLAGAPGEASDGALLDRLVRDQDQAAFESLLQRHGPMVLQVCRGMLRDPHAADDAFQAVFLVLVRRAGSLHGRGSLGGWLHEVAQRVSLKARGTAARRWLHERQAGAMTEEAWTDAAPDNQDLRPVLTEELNRLPEKYRTPLVL